VGSQEDLIDGVDTWLSSQAADFFDTGIKKTYSLILQVPQFWW
jgi:hypothetical protein